MTEAEWITTQQVDEMLRQLDALGQSERKSLLFVVASDCFYDQPNQRYIMDGLEGYADGTVSRYELEVIYRTEGSGFEGIPFDTFKIINAEYLAPLDSESQETGARLIRCIFGNPFRPVAFDPNWCTSTVVSLARSMYESRDFSPMPILSDALQDAGCENEDTLNHCRSAGSHVRGCWVVDLILGKS